MALGESEIGKALSLFSRPLFWEYTEREVPKLGPELVIPRITRYGILEEIIRLFVIYGTDTIHEVVAKDRELDQTEKTFLLSFSFDAFSFSADLDMQKEKDEFTAPKRQTPDIADKTLRLESLLEIGVAKLDNQNRQSKWEDLIELYRTTEHYYTLSDLLTAYNQYYPPMPKKQCFMALWKNLMTPPPSGHFQSGMVHGISEREKIIFGLKKKCIEVGELIFDQETESVKSSLKRI